jgi:hypothetical protein
MISPGREPGGNGVSKPISPGRGDTIRRATSSLLPPLPGLVGIKSRKTPACARGYILPRLRRFPWLHHYLNRSKSIRNQDQFTRAALVASPLGEGERMKVRGGFVEEPRWVALMRTLTLTPLPWQGRSDPCSHHVIPTPKIALVFGRPRNDIYKIALNYSQIAQIYSDPVAETPKSEAS